MENRDDILKRIEDKDLNHRESDPHEYNMIKQHCTKCRGSLRVQFSDPDHRDDDLQMYTPVPAVMYPNEQDA